MRDFIFLTSCSLLTYKTIIFKQATVNFGAACQTIELIT